MTCCWDGTRSCAGSVQLQRDHVLGHSVIEPVAEHVALGRRCWPHSSSGNVALGRRSPAGLPPRCVRRSDAGVAARGAGHCCCVGIWLWLRGVSGKFLLVALLVYHTTYMRPANGRQRHLVRVPCLSWPPSASPTRLGAESARTVSPTAKCWPRSPCSAFWVTYSTMKGMRMYTT